MKTKKEELDEDWSRKWSRTNIFREIETLKRDQTRARAGELNKWLKMVFIGLL